MAFVKFSRGLKSTYTGLSRKDPDTLYLVYENDNATNGELYLGNKLISSVGNSNVQSLADLTDVVLFGELEDGMLLQYNASTGGGQWEAVALSEVISDLPEASSKIDIVSALNDITNPKIKDIAIVGEEAYIYKADGWTKLTDSLLDDRISNLESQVGQPGNEDEGIEPSGLYKDLADFKSNVYTKEEIISQITDLSHLTYKKVNSLEDIDISSDEASTTIYLVPKVDAQEENGFDEYFVVDSELEKIGNWDVDLSNYVQTDDERLLSQSQKEKIEAITLDDNNNIIITASQVGGLSEAIADTQLIKSVAVGTFNVTEEGELQLVGTPSIDLSDYVTNEIFSSVVGNLNDLVNPVKENSTLVEEINAIKESISWQELSTNNGE